MLYCIYGAPILMMLFLPDSYGHARVKSEIFLDIFQIAIVVALIYSTFFFLPLQQMQPEDALLHNVNVSDGQSLILLVAAFVRLQCARLPSMRNLLMRFVFFLLVCAVATVSGDWFALHHCTTALAWFNLGWAVPQVAAGLIALTWTPPPEPDSTSRPATFFSFLVTNLVLVAMLSCVALLTDRWKQAHGEAITAIAIGASLVALTVRLALTQFHQEQEIAQRKAAQAQLAASHQEVGRLLEDARQQTFEITQVSELGSLLQACASQGEAFRLLPARLRRLFPGTSGSIALLTSSKKRVEAAAQWGVSLVDQIFTPEQCWALRRGCIHSQPKGASDTRCTHLVGEGASICIPLIANGEAIGTLTFQEDDRITSTALPEVDPDSAAFARRRQVGITVAEQIALAITNLTLRESLRLQAVRDPLTSLYNRRYMEEFLERELHSARRKHRPLAVMMIDLDHFKRYNDSFGHAAGDQALAAVGGMLLRSVRAEDVACRYGGEEFVLILPECTVQQAAVRAEEIRKRLQDYCPRSESQATEVLTASIGVAGFEETTDRVDLLLAFADDALYQAKRAAVIEWSQPAPPRLCRIPIPRKV